MLTEEEGKDGMVAGLYGIFASIERRGAGKPFDEHVCMLVSFFIDIGLKK